MQSRSARSNAASVRRRDARQRDGIDGRVVNCWTWSTRPVTESRERDALKPDRPLPAGAAGAGPTVCNCVFVG